MARNVSSTARQAINAPQTGEVFLVLVEITHEDLVTPLRFVNNTKDITHNSNTYTAVAFRFTPPVEEDGTISNTSIEFDNVDRSITQVIRSLSSPPSITIKVVLSSSPDTVEAGPWEFILRNVVYNMHTISGDLFYQNYVRNYTSSLSYSTYNFPGLYS